MATEFIKEAGVDYTEIVGLGAGFEGAIACMDVVLELRVWHSTGTAGGWEAVVVDRGWNWTTTTDCWN